MLSESGHVPSFIEFHWDPAGGWFVTHSPDRSTPLMAQTIRYGAMKRFYTKGLSKILSWGHNPPKLGFFSLKRTFPA
jgi:hypothetical protein